MASADKTDDVFPARARRSRFASGRPIDPTALQTASRGTAQGSKSLSNQANPGPSIRCLASAQRFRSAYWGAFEALGAPVFRKAPGGGSRVRSHPVREYHIELEVVGTRPAIWTALGHSVPSVAADCDDQLWPAECSHCIPSAERLMCAARKSAHVKGHVHRHNKRRPVSCM